MQGFLVPSNQKINRQPACRPVFSNSSSVFESGDSDLPVLSRGYISRRIPKYPRVSLPSYIAPQVMPKVVFVF